MAIGMGLGPGPQPGEEVGAQQRPEDLCNDPTEAVLPEGLDPLKCPRLIYG